MNISLKRGLDARNEVPHVKDGSLRNQLVPLRFITCGSVDDGKSTLIGRLLWDSKSVKTDQARKLARDSRPGDNGLDLPEFALLLDGLQAEREQGITIDVAYRYFSSPRRTFIVADTPGHEQYTRNMATGASGADLAVILVDARAGVVQQTRRHAMIAAMMGIRQFVLAINKIDLVDYSHEVFERISSVFSEFALSLGIGHVTAIPVCALKGENVVSHIGPEQSGPSPMPWYNGRTLLETLELATSRSAQAVGFRLPVQRVCRPCESFRGYQGTVAGGAVKPGDSLMVLPAGIAVNVTEIVTFDLVRNAAVAGDAITLVLDRDVDIARGDMICSIEALPMTGRNFEADIIVLGQGGLEPGRRYWLKSASRRQRVRLEPLSIADLETGTWSDCRRLPVNAIAKVRLVFEETAIFDTYAANRDTGSFILIDPEEHTTVAGGMISGPGNASAGDLPHIGAETEGRKGGDGDENDLVLMAMPARSAEILQGSGTFRMLEEEVTTTRISPEKLRLLLRENG